MSWPQSTRQIRIHGPEKGEVTVQKEEVENEDSEAAIKVENPKAMDKPDPVTEVVKPTKEASDVVINTPKDNEGVEN